MRDGQWSAAVQRNYKINDLPALQNEWVAWVSQGFPAPPAASSVMTAAAEIAVPPEQPVPIASGIPPKTGTTSATMVAGVRFARPEPNLIYHIHDKSGSEPRRQTARRRWRPDGVSLAPSGQGAAQNRRVLATADASH